MCSSSSIAVTRTFAHLRRGARRAGLSAPSRSRRRPHDALGAGDLDVCFFSIGTQLSRELVPDRVRGGRGVRRQVRRVPSRGRRSARRARGQRRASARAHRDRGQPELLRDSADDGSRSAARRCGSAQACASRRTSRSRARARRRSKTFGPRVADDHRLRMDWAFDGVEFDEEVKLREETRKILELPELPISASCVRVPVVVGHAEAVWVETETAPTPRGRRANPDGRSGTAVRVGARPRPRGRSRRRPRRPRAVRSVGRERARLLPHLATTCARAQR